jgi:hypothetical protein
MSTPSVEPLPGPRTPIGLLVASTLCWIWGVLCGLGGLALLIPALKIPGLGVGAVFFALAFVVVGAVYCVAGYLIRRARLPGAWLALACAGIVSALELRGIAEIRSITLGAIAGLVVNVAIVLLVALHWRHFHAAPTEAGAT